MTAQLKYPRIMLLVTENVALADKPATQFMSWAVGAAHPFVPGAKVVAMFETEEGVEIYSIFEHEKGLQGVRDRVAERLIRGVQEAMPFNIFQEELNAAELGEPDDDDEGGEGGEFEDTPPGGTPAVGIPNGQTTPSS